MGELYLEGEPPPLPRAPAPLSRGTGPGGLSRDEHPLAGTARRRAAARLLSPASGSRSRTSEIDLSWTTPFQRAVAETLRRCPTARWSPTASWPRSPDTRTRSEPRERSAPGTASRSSCPATASSRRTGSAPTARSAATTSAACSPSRAWGLSLSADVRAELAAIDPRRRAAGSPSSPRSCAAREASTSAAAAGSGCIWRWRARRRAPRLHAPALVRRALRDPHVRRQAFERATRFQLHMDDDARALQVLHEAGMLDREPGAARAAARACRRPALLPRRLPAGRLPRRRLGQRAAQRPSRAPGATPRGGRVPRRARRGRGVSGRVYERGGHAVAYVKGVEAIADLLAFLGAQEAALALGESAVVPRPRARARTGSRTPTTRTSPGRAGRPRPSFGRSGGSRSRAARASLPRPARDRPPARTQPDAVAPRAGRALPAAGDEGGRAAPAGEAPAARASAEHSSRAGRRGSSEDDLPLRLNHAPDRGAGRGLNPTPDERGPAPGQRIPRHKAVQGGVSRISQFGPADRMPAGSVSEAEVA